MRFGVLDSGHGANHDGYHYTGANWARDAPVPQVADLRNIVAGEKLYDIWGVNEDAEYHESGTEGEQAALASVRDVPSRVTKAA